MAWFTSVPEPAVVEVDLELTRTLGPLVRAFDRAGQWTGTALKGSLSRRVFSESVDLAVQNPLRLPSALALGMLVGVVVASEWPTNVPNGAATLAVAGAMFLGLLVDDLPTAIEGSTFGGVLRSLSRPWGPPEDRSR